MFAQQVLSNLSKFYPELMLSITIFVILIVELFFKNKTQISGIIGCAGLIVTFFFTLGQAGWAAQPVFFDMIVIDPFSYFFKMILLLSGALIFIFSFFSFDVTKTPYRLQEYYALILCLTLGGFLMAS